jgi:hypothetical protein
MIDRLRLFAAATLAVILTSLGSISMAAAPASDSASDPAYAAEAGGAWKGQYNPAGPNDPGQNPPGTDNGGTGFGIWNFAGGFNGNGTHAPYGRLNHFIDGVDFPTTAFNDLGSPAFGLGGFNPGDGSQSFSQPQAQRPFSGVLNVGQVFSADIDSPAEYLPLTGDSFPFAIINFLGVSGATTFSIEAGSSLNFGDFPWRYDDANNNNTDFGTAAGVGPITPTATSDGSSISLAITGANTGRFTLDGASVDITFAAGRPASVRFLLFDQSAEGTAGNPTGEHAFYFDNLRIVPEPSSLAMMLLAGLALFGARFRARP